MHGAHQRDATVHLAHIHTEQLLLQYKHVPRNIETFHALLFSARLLIREKQRVDVCFLNGRNKLIYVLLMCLNVLRPRRIRSFFPLEGYWFPYKSEARRVMIIGWLISNKLKTCYHRRKKGANKPSSDNLDHAPLQKIH